MKTILVFPADTHCGSTVGLMRPEAWQLDKGGSYYPSRAQQILWSQWVECWDTVKRLRERGDRVIITSMSDSIDGRHHETTELVTARREEQERIFIGVMDWALKHIQFRKDDILQFVSGTPEHTGEAGQADKRICNDLKGRGIYDRLLFEVHGRKFDVAHKRFGTGRRAWTDDNIIHSILKSMLFSALLQGHDPPDFIIGAHWHQFLQGDFARGKYKTNGFICPAFQFKTTYGYSVTNNDNRLPSIGMLIIVVNKDGSYHWQCPRLELPQEKYEVI